MAGPSDHTPSGDEVQATQRDKLHVVVGWLLAAGTRSSALGVQGGSRELV